MTIFIANTNAVEIQGLKNRATGVFINDATMAVTITKNGVDVAGAVGLVMANVVGSNGVYRAVIPSTVTFDTSNHVAVITASVSGEELNGRWQINFKPKARSSVDA